MSPEPVASWRADHDYFRTLLKLLQRETDLLHSGERPNYELMLDVITYLRSYSDRFHHPREDVAFALLAKHCPDMELALARLRQEHRVIAIAGERLLGGLTAILDDALVPRTEIEAAAATYLVYYRHHIATEEHDVLTRAEDTLTSEDWDMVNAAVQAEPDPLFGTNPEEHYRELRRHIALES